MKKFYLFISTVLIMILFSCSDDLNNSSLNEDVTPSRAINKKGYADGVNYSLNNLKVNPDLVKISQENVTIKSSEDKMKNGIFNFEILSNEIKEKLIVGNVLYFKTENNTYLRKIKTVSNNGNSYFLETSEAYLGDLFSSGTIEFSVNTQQAEKAIKSKSNSLVALGENYDKNFTFNIINLIKEYSYEGMVFNPNTSISSTFNIKIGFGNSQNLPNEVIAYIEFNTIINPYFKFDGNFNKKINHNFIEEVPTNLLDQLKKIELDITIPAGDILGDIPAKISIDEINFPVEIEANIAKNSNLELNVAGKLKVGFAYYNGIPNKKSHIIYENSMKNLSVAKSNLTGEIISDMGISIIPKITLLNTNLLHVNGNINLGLKSLSIGNGGLNNESEFLTKGEFYSLGKFSVNSLGVPIYTTELFKNNKELWNIGHLTQTFTLSNFRYYKNSPIPCSGLNSYSFNVALDYKYPIPGKIITDNLEITYDVYADNGSVLEKEKTIKISPSNISLKEFNFNLCIPFRRINIYKTAKTSYLKNIKIKDANGYVALGIIDPILGTPYTQIPISR